MPPTTPQQATAGQPTTPELSEDGDSDEPRIEEVEAINEDENEEEEEEEEEELDPCTHTPSHPQSRHPMIPQSPSI